MKNIIPKSVIRLIVPIALCLSVCGAIRIVNLVRLNIVKQQVQIIATKLGATEANTIGRGTAYGNFGVLGDYSLAFIPDTPIFTTTITTVLSQCFNVPVVYGGPSQDHGLVSFFQKYQLNPVLNKNLRIEEADNFFNSVITKTTYEDSWSTGFLDEGRTAISIYIEHPQQYRSRFYLNDTQILTDVIIVRKLFDVFPDRSSETLTSLKCS